MPGSRRRRPHPRTTRRPTLKTSRHIHERHVIDATKEKDLHDIFVSELAFPELANYAFKIPDWFLERNVSTKADTRDFRPEIRIVSGAHVKDRLSKVEKVYQSTNNALSCKTTDEIVQSTVGPGTVSKDDTSAFPEISDRKFSSFYDTIASLVVEDGNGKLPSESTVLLRASLPGCDELLDSVVRQLAKDMAVSLVSVNTDDIHDLALEFVKQDETMDSIGEEKDSEDDLSDITTSDDGSSRTSSRTSSAADNDDEVLRYFSRPKRFASESAKVRVQAVMDAFLNSVESKMQVQGITPPVSSEGIGGDSAITIIHVQDANSFMGFFEGHRILKCIRGAVLDCRSLGKKIVLVVSLRSDAAPFNGYAYYNVPNVGMCGDDELKLHQRLHISSNDMININPRNSEECVEFRDESELRNRRRKNVRVVRRALHDIGPQHIDPAVWTALDACVTTKSESHLKFMDRSVLWPGTQHGITRQLRGRLLRKSMLDLDDLSTVLGRLLESEDDDNGDDNGSDKGPSASKKRITEVTKNCDEYETDLLGCIVDPDNFESSYDNVIMDSETKDLVIQMLAISRLRMEASSNYLLQQIRINGLLLYGPPGTGKTHLSRAIAKDSGAVMLAIDSATVENKYVGETEKFIRAAFSLATKLHPCILFIDEADAMFYRRGGEDQSWRRAALTTYLSQMDGLNTNDKSPFVVIATNRPSDLDEAFLRRVPQKVLFTLPSFDDRLKILKLFLKEDDLDPDVNVEGLAQSTKGYSGSDLRNVCGQAALFWASEQAASARNENGRINPSDSIQTVSTAEERKTANSITAMPTLRLKLTVQHFVKAVQRIRPSNSGQSMKELEDFAKRFNPQSVKLLKVQT